MLPKRRKVGTILLPIVIKKGKTIFSRHFSLKFTRLQDAKESKFSIVVSKKVSKKAVDRNSIKRRGYAVIGKNKHPQGFSPIAGVFFAQKGAAGLSYKETKEEIEGLLEHAASQHKA